MCNIEIAAPQRHTVCSPRTRPRLYRNVVRVVCELKRDDTGVSALLGPSGAGNSTLLQIFATTLEPKSGSLRWKGETITARTIVCGGISATSRSSLPASRSRRSSRFWPPSCGCAACAVVT